jgi:hypothetical protein
MSRSPPEGQKPFPHGKEVKSKPGLKNCKRADSTAWTIGKTGRSLQPEGNCGTPTETLEKMLVGIKPVSLRYKACCFTSSFYNDFCFLVPSLFSIFLKIEMGLDRFLLYLRYPTELYEEYS